ncbi:MAG: deoxyguanosinetriphosphate triphosphohydrolase [Pseudomonadota bacterium]
MIPREQYENLEKELLAPYAQLSSKSLGREHSEDECQFRPCFYRDLGRIVHSAAFRRLEYKTQVFVNHEGDYYRTRLTHTLEASQISRGLARILRLNEDLAQTIALAHDLGHSPFGHAGEETLNQLMKSDGGFEHNIHSFRVVTHIEDRYPNMRGLNLSYEVLEGIVKHTTDYDKPQKVEGFKDVGYPTLEAQIVNFADEIAFMNHDLDDGIKCGMLSMESLKEVPLWKEAFDYVEKNMPTTSDKIKRLQTISWLINELIDDLQRETKRRIEKNNIRSLADVRSCGKGIVSHSADMQKKTDEIKSFLFKNMYRHPKVVEMAERAKERITFLFEAYLKDPKLMPDELTRHIDDGNKKRLVCDYIAGMTDRFAIQEYQKLFDQK